MNRNAKSTRPLLALVGLAAVVALAAGCGTTDSDPERGRALFIQSCGNCHAMAEAGTSAQVGPDLDDAFAAAREVGQNDETVKGITEAQVEYPRPGNGNPAASMPAMIVTGQDLRDGAAYVGEWAGVPGAAPPMVEGGPGAQVFANNGCGSCHVLADANAGGVTGPNLDEVLTAGVTEADIEKSIVDPDAEITPGYEANVMPASYGQELTPEELEQLVEFLFESTPAGEG